MLLDLIKSFFLGIVEGLTEFIPVSSTGHLILTGQWLHFEHAHQETFDIAIQLGAILAVVVLYKKRFKNMLRFTADSKRDIQRLIVSMFPALILGAATHHAIKTYLFSPRTVAWGLIAGAFLLIVAEWYAQKSPPKNPAHENAPSLKQAFTIGLFQCLSLWPGMSRSGSTLAGGLLAGVSKQNAAEFSFLLAVPMMGAATGYDLLKSIHLLTWHDACVIFVGFVTAFFVAWGSIVWFMRMLQKIPLRAFAYYRILLGVLILVILR